MLAPPTCHSPNSCLTTLGTTEQSVCPGAALAVSNVSHFTPPPPPPPPPLSPVSDSGYSSLSSLQLDLPMNTPISTSTASSSPGPNHPVGQTSDNHTPHTDSCYTSSSTHHLDCTSSSNPSSEPFPLGTKSSLSSQGGVDPVCWNRMEFSHAHIVPPFEDVADVCVTTCSDEPWALPDIAAFPLLTQDDLNMILDL